MATKKSPRRSARKTTKKTANKTARTAAKRTAPKRPAKRSAAATKRAAPRRAAARTAKATKRPKKSAAPAARKVRPGFIAHTELASADPAATKTWCERVLGWKFGEPMPTPNGPYHMWSFGDNMGGGIRANNPPETPGSVPYVEVRDIQAAFQKALQGGAREMLAPQPVPGNMGSIAIVAAPGGVAIGFWAAK